MTDLVSEKLVPASVDYTKTMSRRVAIVCGVLALLAISLVVDVASGPGEFPLRMVAETLLDSQAHGVQLEVIVWDIRLPIALIAILVGAMLGIAGAEMQTILNNPLAEPFTLGISAAASFGASVAIVLGVSLIPFAGAFLISVNAFVFALGASCALYMLTRLRGVTAETMVLFGIALMFTFNALLSLMQYGSNEIQLQEIVFWMMGSLIRATWTKIAIATALLAVLLPFCMTRTWKLTALRLGEDSALSMGVNVQRLRLEMLIVISLFAATAVSFVGTVGFVGLVGPHIARMIVGEDQRLFLPLSAIIGALVMSVTSIISKSLIPGIIFPIGIITSLVGIPVFVSLIYATRKGK